MAHAAGAQPAAGRDFAVAPLQPRAWVLLGAIAAAIAVAGLALPPTRQLPAPAWLVTPFAVALLFAPLALAMRRRRITVDGGTLVVAATFYPRKVAVDALDLERARIISLAEHTQYAPRLKLNGYSLPGLQAGHFLLRGRQRAFCLLTSRERVLLLP